MELRIGHLQGNGGGTSALNFYRSTSHYDNSKTINRKSLPADFLIDLL